MFYIVISIRDALKFPIMEKTKLIAGNEGIDNQIKWVTTVEVIEDIERIQDGEFLITTGFNLMEDKESMKVFHDLLRLRPLAGVAIYTSFYMKVIPKSFIELANKHHLPLIEIPTDINFSEITKEILKHIINKQTRLLQQSEYIHHELTTLILNDQNLTEVTRRLGQLTNSTIYIYNEFYNVIHCSTILNHQDKNTPSQTTFTIKDQTINLTPYFLSSLEKETKEQIVIKQTVFTIYPIIAKQSCFGWIVMDKGIVNWHALDDIAIERAAPIYAMEFLKNQALEEMQLRIHSNLLEDIISKKHINEHLIMDQALKINYDLSLPQCVFHLTFKRPKKADLHLVDRLYHMTESMLIQKNKQHIIQPKVHSIIFLTNINGKTVDEQYAHADQLAHDLLKDWHYYFPTTELIIGIGKTYDRVKDLGKSAQEAQYASQLNSLIDSDSHIAHYIDLGMYDLLLEMNRMGIDLTTIYKDNIDKLIAKKEREIDLIETIDIYFKNNQSIKLTAEELFIHRHTLRYRLNQIEQRTGLNLKSSDDLLKLQLSNMALKLVNILEKTN